MDDEHFLALGRAVYAFQALEWLAIWLAALLDDGDVAKVDALTFGGVIECIERRLKEDPAAGGAVRDPIVDVVPLLKESNGLRQDVFHSHPVHSDEVLRLRPKSGDLLVIDVEALNAARQHFEVVTVELDKLWHPLWRHELRHHGHGDV